MSPSTMYSGKLWLVQIAEVHVDALRKELKGEGVRGRGIDQDFNGSPSEIFSPILGHFGVLW